MENPSNESHISRGPRRCFEPRQEPYIIVDKSLMNYLNKNDRGKSECGSNGGIYADVLDLSKIKESTEMRRLYVSSVIKRQRAPSMIQSLSAPLGYRNALPKLRLPPPQPLKSDSKRPLIDTPIQATDDGRPHTTPRSNVLSRTRKQLSKRHSAAQSSELKFRNVKTQTEHCARNNIAVVAEPLDFIGLYEKGTNFPQGIFTGNTRDKATQMYEHITQSELFCIEWIHRNLFEVKLNPNTLVVDDKIRNLSESACVT